VGVSEMYRTLLQWLVLGRHRHRRWRTMPKTRGRTHPLRAMLSGEVRSLCWSMRRAGDNYVADKARIWSFSGLNALVGIEEE
jgi:hypothetical protein